MSWQTIAAKRQARLAAMTPERIRQIREAECFCFSQVDLAKAVGIPGANGWITVSRWENGRQRPTQYLEELETLARIAGV